MSRTFSVGAVKLVAFQEAHPELNEALGLWMADRKACERMYPSATEIFRRDMAEFASDA
jgi:hypothetical protein